MKNDSIILARQLLAAVESQQRQIDLLQASLQHIAKIIESVSVSERTSEMQACYLYTFIGEQLEKGDV